MVMIFEQDAVKYEHYVLKHLLTEQHITQTIVKLL